jgi:4-diphosphocytidyl-2-C-methyl-D-erythritol kinase
MLVTRSAEMVVVQAPAKVNLFLEVLGKRPDGYHEIVTCMAAIDLFDTLEFAAASARGSKEESATEICLTCEGAALDTGPNNLVCRAAGLLRKHAGVQRGARIRLQKRIPIGAGLAGGSSDAAATLCGLNELWKLDLPRDELTRLAAQLGSDIPFFLTGNAAWCTGRGEVVAPFKLKEPLHLLLANPGVELSTAAVYKNVQVPGEPQAPEAMKAALQSGNPAAVGRALFNRLQEPAELLCREVADLRELCEQLRPQGHLMSGSGSSYFALGRDRADVERMAEVVRAQRPQTKVFTVKTLQEVP